ncbi:MAG: twin transmembrane helix small protein [Pseudomonadota bacterium]
METMMQFLIPIALAAVCVILLMGLVNMMRGGSPNRSQTLMRMRILFQFIAVIIVMAALYFSGKS